MTQEEHHIPTSKQGGVTLSCYKTDQIVLVSTYKLALFFFFYLRREKTLQKQVKLLK